MPEIKIYLTRTCPFCNMAKRLLDGKGAPYVEIDIGNDKEQWRALEVMTGRNTVPQIFIGDHHVGGYDDLYAADNSGELAQLLN
jgi:glutaredoxin 3